MRISLKEYQKTIENSSNMTKTDVLGYITFVNEEFCKTMGYDKEELLGKTHSIFRHPDNDDSIFKNLWNTINSKEIYKGTIKNLTKDKKTIYLKTYIYPVVDDNDELQGFIANRYDITEEIVSKEKILESEKRLKLAQKMAKMGSWTLDFRTDELTWSEEIYSIFELDKDKFAPSYEAFLDVIHPDDKELVKNAFESSIENKTFYNIEHRLLMKDGRIKYVEESGETEYDEEGNPIHTLGLVQDITKRYLTQQKIIEQKEKLVYKSKMAAMGEMLQNIAHQWKQPLNSISLSASSIRLEKELSNISYTDDIDKNIGHIMKSVEYMSNTINDFQNYLIPNKNKVNFYLDETVSKIKGLIIAQCSNYNITLIENLQKIGFNSYENELMQALVNILKNSIDELVNKDYDKYIFIDIYEKNDGLIIEIKDNAGGIPLEIIDSVFEPYFTTKGKTTGTGVGLYMTKKIIEENLNGKLSVENSEYIYNDQIYKGACFTISF